MAIVSTEIEGTDRRGGKASGNICTCSSNGHDGLLQVGSAGQCSPSCDPHHHQGRFWQALGTPCSHHEGSLSWFSPSSCLLMKREKGLHIILVGPWDQGRSEVVKFQGIPGCRILKEGGEFHVRAFRIPKELMVGCLDKKLHCVMSTGHHSTYLKQL